jgi:hypothetical protein
MAGLVRRRADVSARSVRGRPDARTYADVMKPYSATSENRQGDSPTDQAR